MAKFSLVQEATKYAAQLQSNPPAPQSVRLTLFLHHVQGQGADMGQWTETEWFAAMKQFGINEEDALLLMEDVASWGMADKAGWETPLQVLT